jgi:hypothetical protein
VPVRLNHWLMKTGPLTQNPAQTVPDGHTFFSEGAGNFKESKPIAMDRKDRMSASTEADSRIMQTRGSHPGSLEREAELRRRNEEIDMRQNEALRIAQSVVRQQEAKLVLSPSSARSSNRQVKICLKY